MATTLTFCTACSQVSAHRTILAREDANGNIFDDSPRDYEALKQTSKRFETHLLIGCKGRVTQSCTESFVKRELLETDSPLSLLFCKRIRVRQCKNCHEMTKITRLP